MRCSKKDSFLQSANEVLTNECAAAVWKRAVSLQGLDSSFSFTQAVVTETADLHCSPSSHRCSLMRHLTLCWQEEAAQWAACICLAASSSNRFCFWTFSPAEVSKWRRRNPAQKETKKKQKTKQKTATSWAASGRIRRSATTASEDVWKDSGTVIWIRWFIHHLLRNGTRFPWMAVPRQRLPWRFVIELDELAAVRGAATAL